MRQSDTSPSSALRSISARAAAASIWGRRRFASPASTAGWPASDLMSRISGNVPVVQRGEPAGSDPPTPSYLPQIAETCAQSRRDGRRGARSTAEIPLVLGGDHSIAVGTVSGVSKHFRERGQKLGLIWIDAHTDMNTPDSSPSGNVHGMPLACCVGMGPLELTHIFGYAPKVDPANVALVGFVPWTRRSATTCRRSGRSCLYDARHRRARHARRDR